MSNNNKLNYLEFELYCVKKHSEDFNQITYHWSNIPESELYESGFITKTFGSFRNFRLKRVEDKKNEKINTIQEYGLDGLSIEYQDEDEEKIFHGLQMKLWDCRRKLTGHDLGTFMAIVMCSLQIKNNKSRGYLYHTCKIEETLDILWKNAGTMFSIKVKNPLVSVIDNKIEVDFQVIGNYDSLFLLKSEQNKVFIKSNISSSNDNNHRLASAI